MKLDLIPITEIDLGDRYRENYKDLDRLARSIKDKGLICPIAVTIHPSKDGYLLAAGGRRLAAFKLLDTTYRNDKKYASYFKKIPCSIYDHKLSELEMRSIELTENLEREDLDYREEINLKREIHRLQIAIHGEKHSTNPDAEGHSMRDTAKLLNISQASISQDISLAEAIDEFPEIQWDDCRNKHEAMKLKRRTEEMLVRRELAKRAEKVLGKESTLKGKIINSFIVGDFFENNLESEIFNLVELDPPYAIDLQKAKKDDYNRGGNYGYGKGGYNEVHPESYSKFMLDTLRESYRVMTANSWLICWHAHDWENEMKQWIESVGFTVANIRAVWTKPTGQCQNPSITMASSWEPFYYAKKGNPVLARQGRSNVFHYSTPSLRDHPTPRPIEMMRDILSTFGMEGSRVLVPYAGSGNTLLAAAMEKMIPTGFELTREYKDSFVMKVNELL